MSSSSSPPGEREQSYNFTPQFHGQSYNCTPQFHDHPSPSAASTAPTATTGNDNGDDSGDDSGDDTSDDSSDDSGDDDACICPPFQEGFRNNFSPIASAPTGIKWGKKTTKGGG